MKTGIELIAIERQEQITKHGRTIAGDVQTNSQCNLSFAAALLSCPNPDEMGCTEDNNYSCPDGWNIPIWTKMIKKSYKDRLIIAGALLAAEIDRLNNLA